MLEEPEENRLDQSLRDTFEDFELQPSAPVWRGIEARLAQLPPPPTAQQQRRWLPLPVLLGLVAGLAGWLGWLLPHPAGRLTPQTSRPLVQTPTHRPAQGANQTLLGLNYIWLKPNQTLLKPNYIWLKPNQTLLGLNYIWLKAKQTLLKPNYIYLKPNQTLLKPNEVSVKPNQATGNAATAAPGLSAGLLAAIASPARPDSLPLALRHLAALETSLLATAKPSLSNPATASREAVVATLRAERLELQHLQRRADSLLLALGTVPLAATPPAPAADSATAAPDSLPRSRAARWSLLATAAPEQNTLGLQGRPDDAATTLRQGHETGRAGFSAAVVAEYQASKRLRLGAGLGYTQLGTQFKLTNRRTEVDVTYDTTTTSVLTAATTFNQTYSIRITQVPVLTPVFNGNGQVIDYDTVYTPRQDTLFTTIVAHDTLRSTTRTITPLLNRREVVTSQTFRPQYRFLTLPLQLRYRITPPGPGRWWTDVALGAQLQFFLGGTQAVSRDGVSFHTERITAASGPFRPLNLALSGSLALNYALSPRLSLSVAPSLRWQALSVYRASTGLVQQATSTGVQLGVRWEL